ncbi:type ISP restriction/modification enzyme [Flagellimonas sp.]|uniref:type ISP restriction/modification enzyme n=1 Tax=Flagellimonas sp. TaxID=2058762 RepID=UPI003BA8C02A
MTTSQYLSSLNHRYKLGNSTEHTFRGDLQQLIESLVPEVKATNEPKRQNCGAPDYILTKEEIPVGFIEAKDIGDSDLTGKKKSGHKEQFDRYKASLDNLIFTDYIRFVLYQEGELVTEINIGEVVDGSIKPLSENFAPFENLIKDFVVQVGQTIKSPERLAKMMAGKARLLADVIEKTLKRDLADSLNPKTSLEQQFDAFKDYLIHDVSTKGFADIYAQTITYGLFAARLHDPTIKTFSRHEAAELIPKSNPFLRKLFQFIAGYDLDDNLVWIVNSLVDIFLHSNVEEILKNYGKSTKMEDPIIHFYETFLSEYDPKLRKSRGVWYTPAPVVNFIVRAVDDILKTEFGLPQGLADTSKTKIKLNTQIVDKRSSTGYKQVEQEIHKVQILDPATGTGTFLSEVVKHIYKKFEGQQGIWSNYVETHLLPRLNGFEILMASYAMAHLKLDLLLRETGFKAQSNQRLRVYLTNSLEEHHPDTGTLFANWLSTEANEANHIKRDTPVMCVLGNPPYSGESSNKGEWIMNLMEDYKKEPGGKEKLKERNPKWINDDYVKFIRYGQHFIEKNGTGILAFINPHGFLDNPTFRGMRWHLLKTYDKIYTIDLHGNSKKKETAPDGSPDQNVFDIMQGVSINIFVKSGRKKNSNELGKVYHYDLFGKREIKYDFLIRNTLSSIPFVQLPNKAPNYFMVHKDFELESEYNKGIILNELFHLNNVGIVTARDNFTIHNSRDNVKSTIDEFLSLPHEEARARFNLGKDVRDWKVSFAKKDLQDFYPEKGTFTKVNYRPFDERHTFYTGNSKGFHCYPRTEVMQHFANGKNVGLVIGRQGQVVGSMQWNLAFITNSITDFNLYYRGGGNTYPLYLYQETNGQQTIEESTTRTPNLNSEIVEEISLKLGLQFTPEREKANLCFANSNEELQDAYKQVFAPIDILDYIYAVLHSPTYREKYKEFLKIDFPRVPYPTDTAAFWKLVKLGGELRQIHLLESHVVEQYITQYPEDGDNVIDRKITKTSPGYVADTENHGKVYINDTQYFDKVPLVAWEFYIGGYQPAQKWLKDRKGRALSFEDILHYQKIIVALSETDRIMKEIDRIEIV